MSEKRFYRASVCGDEGLYDKEYGCIIVNVKSNIDLDDNWNVVVEKLNELSEENEQLKKDVENLQEVVAELGATLLMNGFEIEINGENLSELVVDDE